MQIYLHNIPRKTGKTLENTDGLAAGFPRRKAPIQATLTPHRR
jgi:hypothetical protein